jgi:hypothetical protein
LFNNVSSSLISSTRLEVEVQPYTSSNLLVPVELQDSYESLISYKLSRHNGVKLTAQSYNTYNKTSDISYGNSPVIDYLDSCIYEIEWGGGGWLENSNGGGIRLGNIYVVGQTKDDVTILTPETDVYYTILSRNIISGSLLYRKSYNDNSTVPAPLTVTYGALEIPDAFYAFPSNAEPTLATPSSNTMFTSSYGRSFGMFYRDLGGYPVLSFTGSGTAVGFWGVGKDTNGGYIFNGSVGDSYGYENVFNQISSSLNNGGKWFASVYVPSGSSTYLAKYMPLNQNGGQVGNPFEIRRVYTGSANTLFNIELITGSGIYNVAANFINTINPIGEYYNGASDFNGYGVLISQARTPSPSLTIFNVPSTNFSTIGKGYFLPQYSKNVIKDNINYITKTYGSNPN